MGTYSLYEMTDPELEEMGLPSSCECLDLQPEQDSDGTVFAVCQDCGASYPANGLW